MIEVVASANGGWKFMRRTSAGSLPTFRANASTIRSIT